MPERFHVESGLSPGARLELPPRAARHVQVLRLQPGAAIVLFDGRGGQWSATVQRMGRQAVEVAVGSHHSIEREAARAVTLAFGMPANDRIDSLIEKATELGAAALQPLQTERSVVRLAGDRAPRKLAHWQAVAAAACEQCGRNRLPVLAEPLPLAQWLARIGAPGVDAGAQARLLLAPPALPPVLPSAPSEDRPASAAQALPAADQTLVLSGPEGGLSELEVDAARRAGFAPFTLGPRVLRADTAPLAALVLLLGSSPT